MVTGSTFLMLDCICWSLQLMFWPSWNLVKLIVSSVGLQWTIGVVVPTGEIMLFIGLSNWILINKVVGFILGTDRAAQWVST